MRYGVENAPFSSGLTFWEVNVRRMRLEAVSTTGLSVLNATPACKITKLKIWKNSKKRFQLKNVLGTFLERKKRTIIVESFVELQKYSECYLLIFAVLCSIASLKKAEIIN